MITPELTQFVHQQIAAGVPPEVIRESLIQTGWMPEDVQQALAIVALPQHPPVLQRWLKLIIIFSLCSIALGAISYGAYRFWQQRQHANLSTVTPKDSLQLFTSEQGYTFRYLSSWNVQDSPIKTVITPRTGDDSTTILRAPHSGDLAKTSLAQARELALTFGALDQLLPVQEAGLSGYAIPNSQGDGSTLVLAGKQDSIILKFAHTTYSHLTAGQQAILSTLIITR